MVVHGVKYGFYFGNHVRHSGVIDIPRNSALLPASYMLSTVVTGFVRLSFGGY